MAMRPMAAILLPIFAYMMGASILVNVMQVGFRFTTKPIMPNLGKLNPMNGFGRLLGGQNYFQLAMNSVKLVLVGTVGYQRCMHHMAMILSLSDMDFPANMMIACGIVYDLGIRIAVGLLILAIFDWIYHKWKFESSIKMSKQEIKEESRSSEGDPEIKGRRRQMARKMIMQRIRSDVPRADVVVTNPTHLAIALKYDPETMRAPRVLAKGADFLAMSIRQVAIEHGVPIVERKPLAQALYKSVEVGQEVPPEFYQAIAEILAYVYELSGKARTMRQRRPVEQSV